MTESNEGAGRLLWPVLLLGVAADLLFRTDGLGLNVALWLGGAVWAWWRYRQQSGATPTGAERALLLGILGLGAAAVWRENQLLRLLDGIALIVSAALLPVVASPAASFWELSVGRFLRALLHLIRRTLVGLVPTVLDATRPARGERSALARTLGGVARGTVLTVPALLLFGGLLASADRTFGTFLTGLVRVDLSQLASHATAILGAGWLAAAALSGAIPLERHALRRDPPPTGTGLGRVEIGMLLGLLNLLFAAFVAFQLPYFFGGAAWVERTAGVTLAEYAREGFFQLVVVSALVLPLLLGLHAWSAVAERRAGALFRSLAACQVALVLVIMASAIHRMTIYQSEFGLTEERFFASAFIGGLAVTFCWFGATVLRGNAERFTGGALAAWAGWLVLLHVVNPERVIVEANIARAGARHSLDVSYLSGLSSDATPALIRNMGRIPEVERAVVVKALHAVTDSSAHDWRAWHYGQAEARSLVAELE